MIGAWNFPYATTLNPVIYSIAAGNAVCIKPSEMVEASSKMIKTIINEMNDDTLTCIEGGAETAIALLEEVWDVISFTGST